MIFLVNKTVAYPIGADWGWHSASMDTENRKLLVFDEEQYQEVTGWDEYTDGALAVYDGLWGYRFDDTIELKRRE